MKAGAAIVTGSASLFAESIHSFADTLNQSLLLVGLRRAKKPADKERGYGYGTERFFWSLISACGILFVGAGVTVYHSIETLLEQHHENYTVSFLGIVILLVACVIEGATLYVALKELRRGKPFSVQMFQNGDPVVLSVVYEDGAAVLGVLVALCAQGISFLTNNGAYDAVGGIIVGLILGTLAVVLIRKNYHYIIGKPMDEDVKERAIEFLLTDACIEKVLDFKSEAIDVGKYSIYVTVE
jgi:zinc transporter 9